MTLNVKVRCYIVLHILDVQNCINTVRLGSTSWLKKSTVCYVLSCLDAVGAEGLNVGIVNKVDAIQVDNFEVRCGRLEFVDVYDLVDFLLLLICFLIGT